MHSIWIPCLLLASAALPALAINCYSCESTYEPHCSDEFELESYWKLDCSRVAAPRFLLPDLESKNSTACMKKIYEVGDERHVMRSCFFGDVNDTDVGCRTDPALVAVTDIDCLVCDDENYCNAAQRAGPEQAAVATLAASFMFGMVARFLI